MAKRFHFDDEETQNIEESYIDELEKMKASSSLESNSLDEIKDEEVVVKKNKKKKLEWWHYLLIALATLIIIFFVYIFALTNNDGPVYGNRCEGLTTELTSDHFNKVTSQMKKEYSEIQNISLEVDCKQLKIDILFKDNVATKKAKKIAEEAVHALDKVVGKPIEANHSFSNLFGYDQKEPQYEVNLFLESHGNKDFPIFGTKHVSNDQFAYTLSSIKDQESFDKAKDSLKKK